MNIEAHVLIDEEPLAQRQSAGLIHLNVFRPFPEAAVVRALAGKRNVIVLEQLDEPHGQ